MREFKAAAERVVDDSDVLEFTLAGLDPEPFTVTVPTTGQISLVVASVSTGGMEMVGAVYAFLRGLMSEADYRRLREHIAAGRVPLEMVIGGDENNEDGIVDWIVEQVTSRPPTRPTDYLPSQKPDGPRSTGRSRGAGSIPSASLPVAS